MTIGRALVMIACLAHATMASAQAIQPVDYLPLGQGYQWQLARTAGSGPSDLHVEVTDVTAAESGTRYFIEVPTGDLNLGLRLEYATDGSLRLRAVQADLNELLDDLPLDPTATADVQFMPPVLLGAASLVPGSAVVQTPVDAVFDADLQTNIGQVDLDVQCTGTITASWDPASSPTVVPGGSFADVVMLTLDVALTFSEDTFDTEGTVNERVVAVLARGVGFVQIQIDDTTYALDRAIVNGVPIGNFPQYEDLVGLAFTVTPPLISLNGRALGEASSGNVALHDIRLSQTVYGKGQLTAVLEHPAATGVPVSIDGPIKSKKDGTGNVKLEGKSTVGDQKIKFNAKQPIDPTSTAFDLTAKVGKTKVVLPIAIVPVVSGDVRASFDGFVDQSAEAGSKRKLVSNGRLRIGEVEYAIVAKETLTVKKDGSHKHVYNVKPVEKQDKTVVHVEASATSAADFAIFKLKPTLYKREVKKKDVSGITAHVVQP